MFCFGFPLPTVQIQKDQLRPDQMTIANQFVKNENALYGRFINWFWESKGAWGKSHLAKYMAQQMGAYVVSGKNLDVLSTIATIVKKDGGCPPIIIFDVPRVNEGHVSYQAMEGIKNGIFYSGKYEGSMVIFNSPHVIVFANLPPDQSKLSSDRWKITNLREDEEDEEAEGWVAGRNTTD